MSAAAALPPHRRAADWVLERIRDGELPPGADAPSISQLAAACAVPAGAARSALKALARGGQLVTGGQGRPYRVATAAAPAPPAPLPEQVTALAEQVTALQGQIAELTEAIETIRTGGCGNADGHHH